MADQENSSDALDPIAVFMLDALSALPAGKSVAPDDLARGFAETKRKASDGRDLYKRYRQAVKEQAIHLARTGRVDILRRGEPVDPNDFKGVWRLRLKR